MMKSLCVRLAHFFAWLADYEPRNNAFTVDELHAELEQQKRQNKFNVATMQQQIDGLLRENMGLRLELDRRDAGGPPPSNLSGGPATRH